MSGRGRGGGRGGGGGYDRGGSGQRGGPSQRGGGGGARGGYGQSAPPGVFLSGQPVPPPNQKVTDAENKQVTLIKGQTIDGFPTRAGYGTRGTKITVRVNMFEINPNVDSGKAEVHFTSTTSTPAPPSFQGRRESNSYMRSYSDLSSRMWAGRPITRTSS